MNKFNLDKYLIKRYSPLKLERIKKAYFNYDDVVEILNEAEKIDNKQGNGVLPYVSGLLLLHDIEELDNIILELNSRKISLDEFVGKVWNTAYTLGQENGYNCNNH